MQLTDLHLFAEPHRLFNKTNTRDSFLAVLKHVKKHYINPDLIVLTGDLAHDGKPETYQFIADALKVFSAPAYCVLGNHDNRESAYSIYPCDPITMDLHCVLKHWQIIMVDSNYQLNPDSYEGEISEFDLQRIAEWATRYPDKSTLIAVHHNLPEHEDRGVAVEVRNHQRVMQHFEQLPNIKAVISGHVHQEFLIVQNGVCYLSTPSTGYQSTSKSGRVTGEAPGYRWLKLYADGRFETDVRRVTLWPS
ncbi:MAG: metallophosphoesterase [Methylococcaceae bacterium]